MGFVDCGLWPGRESEAEKDEEEFIERCLDLGTVALDWLDRVRNWVG